jgi:hypothetical protein
MLADARKGNSENSRKTSKKLKNRYIYKYEVKTLIMEKWSYWFNIHFD